jgi:hypothetical protein
LNLILACVRGRSERKIVADHRLLAPHIVHIDDKAGVSNRADAAVFAIEHGLIRPTPAT